MKIKIPKIEQAYPCPCGGADDYCGCQDLHPAPRQVSAETLLDWMTHHHLPLQVWRECDDDGGSWVVVDASTDTVLASGGCARDALATAYRKSTDHTKEPD